MSSLITINGRKELWLLVMAPLLALSTQSFSKKTEPLRHTVGKYINIGAAVNDSIIWGRDNEAAAIVKAQFNCIEPENCMKAEKIHPREHAYHWDDADRYVAFGEENGLAVYGHCLVWHSQAARWMFVDGNGQPASRPLLISRMREHIHNVVGRYKGRVKGWDVVNEAVNEDGSLRDTLFCRLIGPDYIKLAFRFAHEADPDAELYINDYSMSNPKKRETYCSIVKEMKSEGLRIDGIGMQSHCGLDYPDLEEYEKSIVAFAKLGVKVMVTELDVNVLPAPETFSGADVGQSFAYREKLNPYPDGLPDSIQRLFDARYLALFDIYRRHRDKIDRINFWNVSDGDSWLNNWPIHGRVNYPTLFGRDHKAKGVVKKINEMFH